MSQDSNEVISLVDYRKRKEEKVENPNALFITHLNGRMKASPHMDATPADQAEVSDRLKRIRSSLEKINDLMSQLKKLDNQK